MPSSSSSSSGSLPLTLFSSFHYYFQTSVYHQLGYGVVSAVKAIMTFDRDDIALAADQLHRAVKFSNTYRKGRGIMGSLSGFLRLGSDKKELKNMTAAERTFASSKRCPQAG